MAMLEVKNLGISFGGLRAVDDFHISIEKGQLYGLIGPNGAGKSTILKSLTRQLKLVGGTVYLDQKLMSQMSGKEVAQKLAVVTTERIRPELMTCEDIVATGRYPYTGTLGILSEGDWEKVHKAMEMVHALDFNAKLPLLIIIQINPVTLIKFFQHCKKPADIKIKR